MVTSIRMNGEPIFYRRVGATLYRRAKNMARKRPVAYTELTLILRSDYLPMRILTGQGNRGLWPKGDANLRYMGNQRGRRETLRQKIRKRKGSVCLRNTSFTTPH